MEKYSPKRRKFMKRTFKKITVILALLCFFSALLTLTVSASTYPITGEHESGNIKWSLSENGELLVTPFDLTGTTNTIRFSDYHSSGGTASPWETFWKKYKDEVVSIVIENKGDCEISSIAVGMNNSSSLKSVIYPVTVTGIGRGGGYAFIGDSALTTLGPVGTLEGVVDLTNIKSVNWDNYNTKYFMRGCSSVTEVRLPSDLIQIFGNMFEGCTSLKRIEIGEKVSSFVDNAFLNCTALREIVFNGTTINNATAFSGCTSLEKVTFSTNLTSISEGVFEENPDIVFYVPDDSYALKWAKENGKNYEVIPPSKGIVFDGYNVRTTDYNGLRAIFFFDKDAIKLNPTYTLLEYGAFVTSAENKALHGSELTYTYENGTLTTYAPEGATIAPVYTTQGGSGAITGNRLDNPRDPVSKSNSVYFALSVVDFEDNFTSAVYIAGYEIWVGRSGEIKVIYTDYADDLSHDANYVYTSLYETYLGIYKTGLVDASVDEDGILTDVLRNGGAVTLDGSLYTVSDAKAANVEGFGDSFTATDIPIVKQTLNGSALTLTESGVTYSLLHDINNEDKYVLLLRGEGEIPAIDISEGIKNQLSPDWYSSDKIESVSGARPNPVFSNAIADNISYIIIDNGITAVGGSAFVELSASSLVYSKSVAEFDKSALGDSVRTVFAAATTPITGKISFPYFYELTINGTSINDFAFYSHSSNYSYLERDHKFTILTDALSLKFERELTGKAIPVAKTMKTGMHYIIISASASDVNSYSIDYKNGNIYFTGSFLSVDEAAEVFVTEILGYNGTQSSFGNTLNVSADDLSLTGSLGLTVPYTKEELLQLFEEANEDDNMVLSGTHTWGTGTGNNNGTDIGQTVEKSISFTGKAPAILELDIGKYSPFIESHNGVDYFRDYDLSKLVSEAMAHVSEGGIIMICQHLGNPLMNSNSHYSGKIGDDNRWKELMTDGTELNEGFRETVDGMRRLTTAFKENGIPFLIRPFHEINGDWFWWCSIQGWKGAHLQQKTMADIWQFYYKMVTEEWGVDNALWVYSPSSGGPSYTSGVQTVVKPMYAYPGDDYVDIIGEDWYTGGDASNYNFKAEGDTIGNYETLMEPGKPTGICEFGYRGEEEYTAMDFLNTLKQMMSEGLKVSFFSTWTWTDSIFQMKNAREFMNHEMIITRDELLERWNNN